MAVIVTYDIPSKHRELKEKMSQLGYKDSIPGTNCKIIYFPNTTLYHINRTAAQAREDVQNTCISLGVNLIRCISTQWGPDWAVICGEDFN